MEADGIRKVTGARYQLAQLFCRFCRFGELRIATHVFKGCTRPLLLKREMFGSVLVADVSRSAAQQMLYLQGERAIPERHLVSALLKPGMKVVDVGANIGYYLAMYERAIGPSGTVACIEPSPDNLKELHATIAANPWTNVTVHECAVGDSPSTMGLRGGVNSEIVGLADGVFQVPVLRLDDLIRDRCDFLKIDVDGYEWLVLQGGRRLLERDRPILFLEYHPQLVPKHGGCLADVLALLRPLYSDIRYFDVPLGRSVPGKVASRYLDSGLVRQFDIEGIPESRLHEGRTHGTFWLVCRP